MSSKGRRRRRSKAWTFPFIRDVVLFVAGLAGLAYETVFTSSDRPTLLLLYAAMLGLPAFLQANNERAADEREIAETLRRRRTLDYENDEEDEDDERRESLLAELKEIEDREKRRRGGPRALPDVPPDDGDDDHPHSRRRAR
jgi:hypothetical protein